MKKCLSFVILLVIQLLPIHLIGNERNAVLTGNVIGRESRTLLILKATGSPLEGYSEIDIDENGLFIYHLTFTALEAFQLVFKDEFYSGVYNSVIFFPDNDTINFTLYPFELADRNEVHRSMLTNKIFEFEKEMEALYMPRFEYLANKLDSLNSIQQSDTDYGEMIADRLAFFDTEFIHSALRHSKKELNVFGYYMFLSLAEQNKRRRIISLDTLAYYHNVFQTAMPKHPYNEIVWFLVNGIEMIKVGGKYIDFTAPDKDGELHTASSIVKNSRFTLLDMWAPWCSPCIGKSKRVLENYEMLSSQGLTVVGVVGGIRDYDQFLNAVERYKYPWLMLSEVGAENHLWRKYSMGASGGHQFLVNSEGIILGIDLTPEKILELIKQE